MTIMRTVRVVQIAFCLCWEIASFGCGVIVLTASALCADPAAPGEDAFSPATADGTSWLYQLQNADPQEITETSFDILVIDYSRDGSESGRYSAAEMQTLRSDSRTVLAYLSVGEAEDYRYYFDSAWVGALGRPKQAAPCWPGRTNPQWKGNYKVQYWSEAWQQIVLGYLDKIIDDGFDGVYLDIIDAYEYWSNARNREGLVLDEEIAAVRMIDLVKRLALHARVTRGLSDFLVFPQNGEAILAWDALEAGDYLATISGIGIEDLYFNGTRPVGASTVTERVVFLDQIKDAGKKVIVTDYVDDGSGSAGNRELIDTFRSAAEADGYVPYAARVDRELDAINTFPGQP